MANRKTQAAPTNETQKTTPQDTTTNGDVQMMSPPPNLTPSTNAVQASINSPSVSAAPLNPGNSDPVQSASPLPQSTVATSSTVAPTSAAPISPASILQSAGELTPGLLTVDGSMGMDSSLLTDLDKFQDSMLDLGDIGNLDMDGMGGMGGMGDMVDF
ncbi:hypothetical protein BGW41_005743 [Actinomortierella wolfii]|nr:hypothetical protein BGW41_005743 [Actinomortierella wolfii]